MLRIRCPYCGLRDHSEFTYGGDAAAIMPDLANAEAQPWIDYVFMRENPKGTHREYWQHSQGCRAWLLVTRDTVTHEIIDVQPARKDPAS